MDPHVPIEVFRARRAALLAAMPPHSAALFLSLDQAARNGDVVYPYRPDSDLWYLTGFAEPDCALVLTKGCEAAETVLFLRDRDPSQELWTGERTGVAEAPDRLGVEAAFPIGRLADELPALIRRAETLIHRPLRPSVQTPAVDRALQTVRGGPRGPHKGPVQVADPLLTLHEIRLRKSDEEVAAIRRANEITAEAIREVVGATRPDIGEWEIQASLESTFRRLGGWGWAYPTIVAGGARACVLHYDANAATCRRDELVLIDAGAEVLGYGADVSRTFPVSDRFTPPQRALYEVVLGAQRAAIDAVRPGTTLDALHELTTRSLVEGMIEVGLMHGAADAIVSEGTYKRYYPHQTSHWLGLDVHDVGRYYLDDEPRPLEPGMVFTIEPGLYVPTSDTEAPGAFRGIGIRIEDDVLVTANGCENLSAGIPKDVAEIEALKG